MVPKDLSAKRVKDKVLYLKLKEQDLLRLDHLTIVSLDDFDKKTKRGSRRQEQLLLNQFLKS